MLVDPGSNLTIEQTLSKVQQVIDVDQVAWLLVHHSDPDIASALPRLGEILDHQRVRVRTEGSILLTGLAAADTALYQAKRAGRDRVMEG